MKDVDSQNVTEIYNFANTQLQLRVIRRVPNDRSHGREFILERKGSI